MITRQEVALKYYNGKCFVCEKKFGKYFQFHHLYYLESEKKFSDFEKPEQYWEYVSKKILDDPQRFLLLCRICHSRIDRKRGGLSRMKKDKVVRLFLATMRTEK
jgi:hypothetical protein